MTKNKIDKYVDYLDVGKQIEMLIDSVLSGLEKIFEWAKEEIKK